MDIAIELPVGGTAGVLLIVRMIGSAGRSGPMAQLLSCRVRVNCTKSMIGHLLGGASGVEGVATVMSVYKQRMHPNLNLDDPDEGVDLSVLMGAEALDADVDVALSNSFGFGGHNSSVVFRRWRA
jgi:3-oxoacyl-(acyl-carrier-protein) synthase